MLSDIPRIDISRSAERPLADEVDRVHFSHGLLHPGLLQAFSDAIMCVSLFLIPPTRHICDAPPAPRLPRRHGHAHPPPVIAVFVSLAPPQTKHMFFVSCVMCHFVFFVSCVFRARISAFTLLPPSKQRGASVPTV